MVENLEVKYKGKMKDIVVKVQNLDKKKSGKNDDDSSDKKDANELDI